MSNKHILVIEDDSGIRVVTKLSLKIYGNWEVTTAVCGEEGLSKASSLHPDVILLDLLMPDLNGFELLKRLHNNQATQKIPIILFTAKYIQNEILDLQRYNIKGIITKPFDCLTLSTRIFDFLNA